jgi:hypothetical protein
VLGALVLLASTDAAADGEQSPMFGGSLVAVRGPDPDAELAGAALELAWWSGRFGLAFEGSGRWDLRTDGARATVLGASARVRVLDGMLPALLESRDVELGVELHAIVERTWWTGPRADQSPTDYGLGLALRLRGVADAGASLLLAESRLFVRVLSSRQTATDAVARTMAPAEQDRALTVLIGIGAAFGAGEPRYLERFRVRPIEIPLGNGRAR